MALPTQPLPLLPQQPSDPNIDVQIRRFMQQSPWNSLITGGYIRMVAPGVWVIPGAGENYSWYPLSNAVNFGLG